jgi:hypothetical protein
VIVADKRCRARISGSIGAPAGAERQYTVLDAGWVLVLSYDRPLIAARLDYTERRRETARKMNSSTTAPMNATKML